MSWIDHQADHHPLVSRFPTTLSEHVLSLIHEKAYREAASNAQGLDALDLGCNSGYGTAMLAERCRTVVGADVSAAAVQVARSGNTAPNATFCLIDGQTLPFDDASFDLITSFQVIEHIEDVRGYLREMARVMRPRGTLMLTTPNASIRLNPGLGPWNPFHLREYTADELQGTLVHAFEEVTVLGLFGSPGVTRIELERVERARLAQLRESQSLVRRTWRRVRDVLPGFAVEFVRSIHRVVARDRSAEQRPSLANSMPTATIADLYYESAADRLPDAIDLLALCRVPSTS